MTVTVDVTSPTTVEVDTTEGVTLGSLQAERNAREAADALLIPLTQKGAASGVASLDGAGTIPDGQIPASIARDAEVSSSVSTAVAALVASAPSTLDTLNELATALADDPNFATTITNALAGKQPLDADLTAIAALTTTTFGRALLALANAAALRTAAGLGTAATANVGDFDPAGAATAAAAALVNSSPSTLDTLKELADALGDDPNFATTTATALGGKQPLDSDLTAIAALDSSTAGALATDGAGWIRKTYAQLKTALGLVKGDVGLGNVDNTSDANKPVSTAQQAALDLKANPPTVVAKTAAYTMTFGELVLANATGGAFTVTLPAAASGKQKATVKKVDASANAVTVAPASGTIDGAANQAISNQWESRDFITDGTNWYQI